MVGQRQTAVWWFVSNGVTNIDVDVLTVNPMPAAAQKWLHLRQLRRKRRLSSLASNAKSYYYL